MSVFSSLTLNELSELREATTASTPEQLLRAAQKGSKTFYAEIPRGDSLEVSVPIEVYRALMLGALDGEFIQRLLNSTADKVKQ